MAKGIRNKYRYFPNKDVNRLRFLHFHKKASAQVSKVFSNLNHTETMLIVSTLDYCLLRGVKSVTDNHVLQSITGNFLTIGKLKGVWEALIKKGILEPCQSHPRSPETIPYRLSHKGKQVIDIYLNAQEEQLKKYTPKYQRPLTMAEYFSE